MVNISKPISSGQLKQYYKADFSNARENYYTEGATVRGEFHGQLAARWGLQGEVSEEQFARLAEGQHPVTGEQLVRHQKSVEYVNWKGEMVRTMEHRSCFDATWSASKSISLVALVGGDDRVRQAHRESVRVALDELEKWTQARIGGRHPGGRDDPRGGRVGEWRIHRKDGDGAEWWQDGRPQWRPICT